MSRSPRRKKRAAAALTTAPSSALRVADMCGQDTGGQSYKLSQAITEFTDCHSRSFRANPDYLEFPVDIDRLNHNREFVRRYLASVNIVHVHNFYRRANGWAPINQNARWLIHQHGRIPKKLWQSTLDADKSRKALRVVSTLNLLSKVDSDPERWIPAPMDLRMFDRLKKARFTEDKEEILVAHSPTRRDYKGTDLIAAAVAKLRSEGLSVRLVLIEKQSHVRCLKQKAACDITYDQMHLCYGNSGLEGMSFSQPTIVGMDDKIRAVVNDVVGYEPFVFASPKTLTAVLRDLVEDASLRKNWGDVGREYVEAWHSSDKVAKRVVKMYESLPS